jgi:DNA-binding PadR family transcriptional regulator
MMPFFSASASGRFMPRFLVGRASFPFPDRAHNIGSVPDIRLMKVAPLNTAILAVLHRTAAEMTTAQLFEVFSKYGKKTSLASLRLSLRRMTTQGLVVRRPGESRTTPGRFQYFYSATEEGRAVVHHVQGWRANSYSLTSARLEPYADFFAPASIESVPMPPPGPVGNVNSRAGAPPDRVQILLSVIPSAQIRAARAMLGWSKAQLAELSGLTEPRIRRAESIYAAGELAKEELDAIEAALIKGGIEFLNGPKAGVRMK